MQFFSYKFTPSLWPTVIFVLLLPLFISMGLWQISRADEKQQLYEDYISKKNGSTLSLTDLVKDAEQNVIPVDWTKVKLSGRFIPDTVILLDNKIVNRQVGYYVFKAFEIEKTDKFVLVNLGWIAAGIDREKAPKLKSVNEIGGIIGVIKQPQYSGIALNETDIELLQENIIRVQNINYQQLSAALHRDLEHYIVRVMPGSKQGYFTDWPDPGFGKEKHHGYAFQWFSFAIVLVGLYLYLNIHRIKSDE